MKKRISILLILSMILSLFSVSFALEPETQIPIESDIRVTIGSTSYIDTLLTNVSPIPNDFQIVDGVYPGWCVDKDLTIYIGPTYDTDIYNPYLPCGWFGSLEPIEDPGYPTRWEGIPWAKLTYLINSKTELFAGTIDVENNADDVFSVTNIQHVIWFYTNGSDLNDKEIALRDWVESMPVDYNPLDAEIKLMVLFSGYDPINSTVQLTVIEVGYEPGTITIKKFIDYNLDGVRQEGEPYLDDSYGFSAVITCADSMDFDLQDGVILEGENCDAGISIPTTLSYSPGEFDVTECANEGWTVTTEDPIKITVVAGVETIVEIGNIGIYEISGFKYDEDTGERLSNWEIHLENLDTGKIWTEMTSADGSYHFENLIAGKYEVREVMQDDWEQVFPSDSHIVNLPDKDVVYGIQRSTGMIFEIDPLTAQATEYFQTTLLPISGIGPNGLALDQITGDLYFSTYPGLAKLYVTDSPKEEYLGELEGDIACADFFDGKYYYIASATDDLYEVTFDNVGVAGWTKFSNISGTSEAAWTFNGDIAVSADGVIYGFGKNNTGGAYEFFKVNRDGTEFEMIKDSGYIFSLQLSFSGDGLLYGHNAQNGEFYSVDIVDGSIVLISDGDNTYTDTSSGILTYNFANRTTLGELPAFKFYDANVNGEYDEDIDTPIEDWKIQIFDGDQLVEEKRTDANGEVLFTVPYGEYTVQEVMPIEECWMATTDTEQDVTVVRLETADRVEFGNVCLGEGGGKTLGFWSNKNGQKLIGIEDLQMLVELNLVNHDGTDYDPVLEIPKGKDNEFRIWLLDANAVNMARMLSTQLAAMELNVFNELVDGEALIYAPETMSANMLGFATVNSIMEESNTELGLHNTAYDGDSWRTYQEALKDALDDANNNLNFLLEDGSCGITY